MPEQDSSHCPLCGQANACAVAAGKAAQDCWCMIRPVSLSALQQLAPEMRGLVCICPQCARPASAPQPTQTI